MRLRKLLTVAPVLLAGISLAANPQDEQLVRNSYAKVAYAVQSRTVYVEVLEHPYITTAELAKKLQENELRFDIAGMSSGAIADILARPYSDFASKPDLQDVLYITNDQESRIEEDGTKATSYFADPHWGKRGASSEDWDLPIRDMLAISRNEGLYSRYVTATVTARFQNQSRTYRTLWLFSGSDLMAIDTVTGNFILRSFATESAYPSVLTDTHLRSRTVVNDWLNSAQRFDASCKTGKLDVCCDSALRCGVAAGDLRSTKPAGSSSRTPLTAW